MTLDLNMKVVQEVMYRHDLNQEMKVAKLEKHFERVIVKAEVS